MSVFRQSKKHLYKEKHSYKSKHNKVQTINDIDFKNRAPKNYVVLSGLLIKVCRLPLTSCYDLSVYIVNSVHIFISLYLYVLLFKRNKESEI